MSCQFSPSMQAKLMNRTYRCLPSLKERRRVHKHKSKPSKNSTQTIQKSPPKLPLTKSSWLNSPRRSLASLSSRQLTTIGQPNAKPQSVKYPLTPSAAIRLFKDRLTSYELGEILEFSRIYYIGNTPLKNQSTRAAFNWGFDDRKGHYQLVVGDHVRYRYEILNVIGKGSFGKVSKCIDHKTKELVALKVIRNKEKYHAQALVETRVLMHLNDKDPQDKKHVIRVKAAFVFRSHIWIAFELLSINLYELIRFNQFEGVSMGLARNFAVQLLTALEYVHAQGIIHCDLKPENVLLSQARSEIKVIDFGSSCFEDEIIYTYIQSRFYRAPEIVLGIPYTSAIDMWSFACIIGELFAGNALFPGENEHDQLYLYISLLGLPPPELLANARRKDMFFDEAWKLRESTHQRVCMSEVLKSSDPLFIDFLEKILVWDPALRLTPKTALLHPWIRNTLNTASRRCHMRTSSFLASDYTTFV